MKKTLKKIQAFNQNGYGPEFNWLLSSLKFLNDDYKRTNVPFSLKYILSFIKNIYLFTT